MSLPNDVAVRIYEHMLLLRALDGRMMSLQRQGRIGFYGEAMGQEWPAVRDIEPLESVMAKLKQNVNGLRVTDESGETLGIVRNRDVIAALVS